MPTLEKTTPLIRITMYVTRNTRKVNEWNLLLFHTKDFYSYEPTFAFNRVNIFHKLELYKDHFMRIGRAYTFPALPKLQRHFKND